MRVLGFLSKYNFKPCYLASHSVPPSSQKTTLKLLIEKFCSCHFFSLILLSLHGPFPCLEWSFLTPALPKPNFSLKPPWFQKVWLVLASAGRGSHSLFWIPIALPVYTTSFSGIQSMTFIFIICLLNTAVNYYRRDAQVLELDKFWFKF